MPGVVRADARAPTAIVRTEGRRSRSTPVRCSRWPTGEEEGVDSLVPELSVQPLTARRPFGCESLVHPYSSLGATEDSVTREVDQLRWVRPLTQVG